ncbi:MAG TPA: redoxin domain-containing protein [Pyrinomonadaceae bacterium]|jgi:thiol-disulfide isomerase/thioredoxin|nr:redoxin domain-containing protein [Pyrinomonadaceae bacterium]
MPMRIGTPMPSLEGVTEWLSGSADEALKDAEGRPLLIHFWAVSCGMCKDNLPRVAEWRQQYRDQLRIIAVHMPRYPEDTNIDAVREAVTKYEITDALAIDNEHKLRDAFENEQGYVPAYYLFDAEHKLKSFAAGEYGVKVMAPALERMLGAKAVVA